MDFLLGRPDSMAIDRPVAPEGSLEDLLACAGTWSFDPGELENLLQDVEDTRLMELKEDYDNMSM